MSIQHLIIKLDDTMTDKEKAAYENMNKLLLTSNPETVKAISTELNKFYALTGVQGVKATVLEIFNACNSVGDLAVAIDNSDKN